MASEKKVGDSRTLKIAGLLVKKEELNRDVIDSLVDKLITSTDCFDDSQSVFVPIPLELELVGNSLSFDDNGIYLNLKLRKEDEQWHELQYTE